MVKVFWIIYCFKLPKCKAEVSHAQKRKNTASGYEFLAYGACVDCFSIPSI